MSDEVELMEFWPVDADENIGFVAADSDFQLWLLDGIGISFDDISYSVVDGPDESGIYELVLDYEDYTTLSELYDSYLGDNEYASEEDGEIHKLLRLSKPPYGAFVNPDGTTIMYVSHESVAGQEQKSIDWGLNHFGMTNPGVKFIKFDSEEEDSAPVAPQKEFGEPVTWIPFDDRNKKRAETFGSEGANPSGGATGDQIIAWEHNGLSSPSGPPSDIMWAETEDNQCTQCFTAFEDKDSADNCCTACYNCGYADHVGFERAQKCCPCNCAETGGGPNGTCQELQAEGSDFNAQMGHSRFQKSDNPRRDMSSTRRKLKQEMFSDVSGVVTLKNMAILGLAGITGYLIAGRK